MARAPAARDADRECARTDDLRYRTTRLSPSLERLRPPTRRRQARYGRSEIGPLRKVRQDRGEEAPSGSGTGRRTGHDDQQEASLEPIRTANIRQGSSYVVFGKSSGFAPLLALSSLVLAKTCAGR